MNRFYKKVSFIFVMAFAIMLGCFSNVLAANIKQLASINESEYSKIYYVSENLGDDLTGDGSKEKPYKTFEKLVHSINLNTNTLVYLDKGLYTFTNYLPDKGNNCKFSVVGKNYDTIFRQESRLGAYTGTASGIQTFTLQFYNLIYTCNPSLEKTNTNIFKFKWNFYNVMIKDIINSEYSYFASNNEMLMYNCTKAEKSANFLRTDFGSIKLYNCYGPFTSGYSTAESSWNANDNKITQSANLDVSNYKILDTNVQNDKYGVYSGEFAWGYNDNIVVAGITLNKTADTLQMGQTDMLTVTITPDNATNKSVKWTSDKPEVATVDENGKVTAIKEGTATITATTQDGSNLSASCTVSITSQTPPVPQGIVLNIEPEKNKIHLNETVSANLTMDNIKDIAAEDVRIKYDSSKLQFLGADEVEGIKLVKQPDSQPGELRFIIASKGEANIVNAKKALLKLKFKGIAKGEALVDITKGRVSDGIEMEDDLADEQCGQATIIIDENVLKDVNNSGGFTLLDLGIDARHMGKDPKSAELAKYNTDVIANNAIDDADLLEIGKLMLENPDYKF